MASPTSSDNLSVVIPIVAGVGNALMAVPMVRQIKRRGHDARVSIVALTEAMAEPLRRLPEVAQVFVSGRGWRGYARGVQWTRRQRADVYLVPFPSNRWQYDLLAAASGARRVAMHQYGGGPARADRLPAERGIHDVVQNLRLLKLLGIEPDERERPQFILNDTDRQRADELLRCAGMRDGQGFVAVHAGSAKTVLARAKRWPPQRYAELIDVLRRDVTGGIVLLEGPDEAGVAAQISSHIKFELTNIKLLKLTGPLGDAAAVLERASLYVGSDSGLAHLAAAVGTPAVTLFAPADPDRVCPMGYRHLVVQPPRDCSPCMLYPWNCRHPKIRCQEPMCIEAITVSAVVDAVHRAQNAGSAAERVVQR